MSNRFISNIVVLLIFGIGFFGVTFAINWFAYGEVETNHEYSFERRTADKHKENKNWESAARYYKQLAVSDPENGNAIMLYADCIAQQRYPFLNRIFRELNSNLPDQSVIDDATAKANELSVEAITAYEQLLEFAHYRDFAHFRLALMHGLANNKEYAIKHLEAAIRLGYKPKQRLQRYLQFQSLLDEPEFKQLL